MLRWIGRRCSRGPVRGGSGCRGTLFSGSVIGCMRRWWVRGVLLGLVSPRRGIRCWVLRWGWLMGGWLFTGRLSLESHPWLADHAVMGGVLLPGTAFVELALRAGGECWLWCLRELTLEVPLLLGEGARCGSVGGR